MTGYKLVMYIILLLFWLVVAGFSTYGLLAGLVCSAIIVLINQQLFGTLFSGQWSFNPGRIMLLTAYLTSLLWQIVLANLQLARIVLDPRLPIQPGVVTFDPGLKTDLTKTLLANSITLTPGTLTIAVEGDSFIVHALTVAAARDVVEWPLIEWLRRMEEE